MIIFSSRYTLIKNTNVLFHFDVSLLFERGQPHKLVTQHSVHYDQTENERQEILCRNRTNYEQEKRKRAYDTENNGLMVWPISVAISSMLCSFQCYRLTFVAIYEQTQTWKKGKKMIN